jgi:phage tail-like protein
MVLLSKVGVDEVEEMGAEAMRIVPLSHPEDAFMVPFATDLEFMPEGERQEVTWLLVVARGIGQDFARYDVRPGTITQVGDLKARGYDGRGIVRAPDGRITYRTEQGIFRNAVTARTRYLRRGRVTTFQLDSGQFQTQWGRIFLDACIPKETEVRVVCTAIDEPPEEATLPRTSPANSLTVTIHRPDLSPSMPPLSLIPEPRAEGQRLHARVSGRELPWSRRGEGDLFRTYEAPVIADAGRYLWVTVLMTGNSRTTPRIQSLRVEYPTHDLLRRLPRVYSRGDQVDFLRRYLAMFDGTLSDLELRAFHRHALIDSSSTPEELLPWLGGFTGMLVDQRFSEHSKRRLVQEAISLFRMRGTIQGLQRLLEIYLSVTPILVEHYRARGLGGAYVGEGGDLTSRAVVGAGFRVGGKIGHIEDSPVTSLPAEDAFRLHAHRFSVIVPASLSSEQADVIDDLLELHRPAHTVVDVCTVDAGMRVGLGLYAELTSIVGRTSGFGSVRAGHWLLGRKDVLGRPGPAGRFGSGQIGVDSVTG